jgi:hypothetical protein
MCGALLTKVYVLIASWNEHFLVAYVHYLVRIAALTMWINNILSTFKAKHSNLLHQPHCLLKLFYVAQAYWWYEFGICRPTVLGIGGFFIYKVTNRICTFFYFGV